MIAGLLAPRLLLISQPDSYRLAAYLAAAQRLGLDALVGSRGRYSLVSEVHDGLHIDLDAPDTAFDIILDAARAHPFAGVLGCDDGTVELAARVAQALDLPHNPPAAARISRRKDLARAHLSLAGCPVPIHCLIDLERPIAAQMAGLPWPCVLKPLNQSGSRGVIRVDDAAEFTAACERLRPVIATTGDAFERTHILVEAYIPGTEVAWEGYLQAGRLATLTLFDKPDPLEGPYFQETIYVTPSRLPAEVQARITARVQEACTAYGLTTGAIHAELRVNEDDVWILEVAARTIGGDCARVFDSGNGYALEEMAVALATARPFEPVPLEESRGVMMIPVAQAGVLRRVEGLAAARKVAYIESVDIVIRSGHELVPLPEGSSYPGFIFARGPTPEVVEKALREAHACLNIVTAPVWRIGAG